MQDPATAAMMELQRVHGIGAAKASVSCWFHQCPSHFGVETQNSHFLIVMSLDVQELAESGVTSLDELQKPEYQAS